MKLFVIIVLLTLCVGGLVILEEAPGNMKAVIEERPLNTWSYELIDAQEKPEELPTCV